MKKFISFILVVVMIFPILPNITYCEGQVMEIDALFGNLKLKVEEKSFPHKETFIYDGELWVPIKDLAKALNMKCSFNSSKRVLKLNSNGKLNIKDNSKEPIAYQRGYEIQAKEKLIAELDREIREFEGKSTSIPSNTNGLVRNIKVGFSDIALFLDGKKINLDREPLLYNGDVYISLVSLSPVLYITPQLKGDTVDIDANAILVNKPGYSNVEKLVAFRESLNDRLSRELAELEKKKKLIMDVKIPYEEVDSLGDMEWYLNKHLSKINELPVDINLSSGTDSWYYVDISFPRRYDYRWRNLTRRDVEAYVWDIYVAITSLYDEGAKIQGNIRNPYYSYNSTSEYRNYVEFNTKIKDIVFSFVNSKLDMTEKVDPTFIEELLQKHLDRYYRNRFDFSARISGYDLELIVNPNDHDFIKKWSVNSKLRFLREINYEIKKYYPGLKVNGKIEYPGEETIEFLIDNGKIRSSNLEKEMVDYLNNRYGVFNVNGIRIPMKYGFHQVNLDDYKLMVDMDFDMNVSHWNQSSEEALGSFLQDVIGEIIALWDVNIFTQAYDKNQTLANEFIISQGTVNMVNADPISGQIVEGSTVRLYTNTAGADIYYTTDGTTPSANNRISYTEPIVINNDTVIKAYATKEGLNNSSISTFEYKVISSKDIAEGLDDLVVEGGKLEPGFEKHKYDYSISVPYSIDSIRFTATASKGSIIIDGAEVSSGNAKDIQLNVGQTKVTITHKEAEKADRLYTIVINRDEEGAPDVKLDSNYTFFVSSMANIFEGKLISSNIRNFSGYQIQILPKTNGEPYTTIDVTSDGSFKCTELKIDQFDVIFGLKYKIIDNNGNPIPEDKDGNVLTIRN